MCGLPLSTNCLTCVGHLQHSVFCHSSLASHLRSSTSPDRAARWRSWAHNLLETNELITKDLVFGRVPDAFRPPPGASSVAYRSQSELPQCCGLCRSHTFTYAKNLLELPHLQTKSALHSRLHRRTLSTRLHPKCQLPTLPLAVESARIGILLLVALRRPLILRIPVDITRRWLACTHAIQAPP